MELSNTFIKIEIVEDVFIKISKELFIYEFNKFDHEYYSEIKTCDIRKIIYQKKYLNNNVGCNPLFSFFGAMYKTEFPSVEPNINLSNLVIKYSISENERDKWEVLRISWSKIDREKVKELIRVVKSYNKNVIIKL